MDTVLGVLLYVMICIQLLFSRAVAEISTVNKQLLGDLNKIALNESDTAHRLT